MTAPVLMPFQDSPFNADSFMCKEFLKLKEKYNLNVAVETGSCLYSTTEWLGKNFNTVHTVELSEEYSKHGIHKVAEMPNVHAEIGDSVTFLRNLMPKLADSDRALYFLDAHWGDNCPLLAELDALCTSKCAFPPIIAIHDFFTGDEKLGWDVYNGQRFDYEWIEPKVKALETAFNCTYTHYYNTEAENGMRGVIYLVPVKSWINDIKNVEKWKKYSQEGEEAYIDFILSNIPDKGKHLVELGAWDGHYLSNTRHLIEDGYTALLIDGDNRGNNEVKEHFITKDNVVKLLNQYNTPEEFDLLVIDLDGNDHYILDEVLGSFKPSLVVAEFNPIFENNESKVITYNENHRWNNDDYYGFSFKAGIKLGRKHGYTCVFQNDSLNMYFVRNEFVEIDPKVTYTKTNYHPASNRTSEWLNY